MKLKMISSFMDSRPATLSDLEEGATAVLSHFELSPRVAEHLMNLGFIPGVEITVSRRAPGGGPRIYRVDGSEVALRTDVARRIAVRPAPAAAEA